MKSKSLNISYHIPIMELNNYFVSNNIPSNFIVKTRKRNFENVKSKINKMKIEEI